MNMKVYFALTVFLSAFFSPLVAHSAEQIKDWALIETKNADGSINKTISTQSKDNLQTLGKNGEIELGYRCNQNFFVQTSGNGFAINDVKCGSYGCKKVQASQIQFDTLTPSEIDLEIWDNGKGMTLLSGNSVLAKSMKKNRTIKLELEARNADDKQQLVSFSLMGFSAAYNWCNKN